MGKGSDFVVCFLRLSHRKSASPIEWVVRKTARDNLARLMALHNCSLTPERERGVGGERERERKGENSLLKAISLSHTRVYSSHNEALTERREEGSSVCGV
jgi:hypothetical protein